MIQLPLPKPHEQSQLGPAGHPQMAQAGEEKAMLPTYGIMKNDGVLLSESSRS